MHVFVCHSLSSLPLIIYNFPDLLSISTHSSPSDPSIHPISLYQSTPHSPSHSLTRSLSLSSPRYYISCMCFFPSHPKCSISVTLCVPIHHRFDHSIMFCHPLFSVRSPHQALTPCCSVVLSPPTHSLIHQAGSFWQATEATTTVAAVCSPLAGPTIEAIIIATASMHPQPQPQPRPRGICTRL